MNATANTFNQVAKGMSMDLLNEMFYITQDASEDSRTPLRDTTVMIRMHEIVLFELTHACAGFDTCQTVVTLDELGTLGQFVSDTLTNWLETQKLTDEYAEMDVQVDNAILQRLIDALNK